MKSFRWKVAVVALAAFTMVAVSGCNRKKERNEIDNIKNEKVIVKKGYSEEMASFLNTEVGEDGVYSGFAEFGFTSKIDKVKKTDVGLQIEQINKYTDMNIGEFPKTDEELTKKWIYTVNSSSIREEKIDDDIKISLISDMVIIKKGLGEGEKWSHKVIIDEREHDAVTKVTEISKDESGRVFISLEIVVDGVDGYSDLEKYREERTYTQGEGITRFSVNFLSHDNSTFDFTYEKEKRKRDCN